MTERWTGRRRAACHLLAALLLFIAGAPGAFGAGGIAGASADGESPREPVDPLDPDSWSIEHYPSIEVESETRASDVELILDDGSREADVGFGTTEAFQFLWLNQFDRPPSQPIDLREISVLFPPGPGMMVDNDVQLVVYFDPDGDPTNGAELLLAFDDVIQAVDGTTFSVYPIDPPVSIIEPGDVLIGVVNRFVESGVSPPSRPAALDTTTSQGRSWFALWIDDPPPMPELPPDLILDTIDVIEPGNWMIRGFATPGPIVDVPALSPVGLGLLALAIGLAGGWLVRRRSPR